MKFLLVSESKLKITLKAEEMKAYSINPETVDRFNSVSRRGFWRVLEIAKLKVGFDATGDKVLIQFYPINASECEVFVTKLGVLSPQNARLVSKSSQVNTMQSEKSYYAFFCLSDLFTACTVLSTELFGESIESGLYSTQDGALILCISEYKRCGERTEFPILTEYSRQLPTDISDYISEHATPLITACAVENIASGFTC